ncbi:MAG TPA: 3-oxoacyl-[acyl-carrier-protein] synthase III C-terminal domain-containing protein [Longimicrobium sp.]|jgi:3-oxoacyl-[acyl-carrier-protein] synthase III|uniref:3-oxoacyl-ACP synthase III family protein n=1 Tax=Longimicrobium sp. TaxID=2029185 RepID=UPI002EDAA952
MIQVTNAFGTRSVRVAGAGAYVPPRVVDNASITQAIPGWSADWISEKTQIRERRFLWDLDARTGVTTAPADTGQPLCNTDMCEAALRRAMQMAGLEGSELDAVFIVTCTPDRVNFSYDAMEVHRRVGCRPDCYAMLVDDGCGGTPYVMDLVYKMIRGGAINTAAVIGSAFTSALVDRDVWTGDVEPSPGRKRLPAAFGAYVFGDGAGAVILRGDGQPGQGIVSSMAGNDYLQLVIRRAGGIENRVSGMQNPADQAFVVDGQLVARSYPTYMNACIAGVLADRPELRDKVQRYYFHQPNKRLMDHYVRQAGLPADRVACNVDRYGNTSAAGMLILLAEDLEQGVVSLGSGDLVLIAAVGANVHYGAQLIRL